MKRDEIHARPKEGTKKVLQYLGDKNVTLGIEKAVEYIKKVGMRKVKKEVK